MAAGGGWIIQGERGSGKGLAAMGKAKEYIERGCPVATNMDMFLEKLVNEHNTTVCYRLPDFPRVEDFEALPVAYDVNYKGAEHNGLLILDELGALFNSRSWNDKGRLGVLHWLFQSRKYHWDLLLLVQDVDTIDVQMRNTLCDYLVQASRLDRQKIPYLGAFMDFLGFNGYFPKIHVYHVYYGISTQNPPVDKWRFSGQDLYQSYDTNQIFKQDSLITATALIDMRALYTYLPAAYLTRRVYVDRLQAQIDSLLGKKEVDDMAVKTSGTGEWGKIILLTVAAVAYFGYRAISGGGFFSHSSAVASPAAVVVSSSAAESVSFLATLLQTADPYLSASIYDKEKGLSGVVKFRDKKTGEVLDSVSIAELHGYDATLISQQFGAVLMYQGKKYIVRHDKGQADVKK